MKIRSHYLMFAMFSILTPSGFLLGDEKRDKTDQTTPAKPGVALFENQILPALIEHCYECHSRESKTTKGGLALDSPSAMLRGGDSGPMILAHNVDQSPMLHMLRHEEGVSHMPPDKKLPDALIASFETWIRLGAPDPRKDAWPTARQERLSRMKNHWAFVPPQSTKPPTVKDTDWPLDPMIDNFVLARIEAEGLKPVTDAGRLTLVRRMFFDLIGLPPSPRDIESFLSDDTPKALETLVDKLLDSPHFGERWGRHWLDVVRYAESSGMEFNFTYPHAWPYRNYVIDSLNADKAYDVFIREQIAGDLLPVEAGESAETTQMRRIAPSILAFGPKRHNSSGTEFQMDIAADQIDVVTKSTLALTVSCARCHDHKFDPIPTKDYYAMAGIFLSTEPLFGTIKQKYSNTPTDLLPIGKDAESMHAAAEQHDRKLREAEKSLAEKRPRLKEAIAGEKLALKEKSAAAGLVAMITAHESITKVKSEETDDNTNAADTSECDAAQAKLDRATVKLAEASAIAASLNNEVTKLENSVGELKKNSPKRPQYAMSARDRAKPADTKLAIRGDHRTRGEIVPRGFLSAVTVPNVQKIHPTHSGRLELAEWITSPDNPLVARVMVNRMWHHLFGRGIVATVDNFGMIGKPPTHPQLLDVLALRFIDEGWSVKRMLRAIVLSRTYQLSSRIDEQNTTIDPDNRLFWRATPRRLEAEAIRDAVLKVSGQLDVQRPHGSTVTALGDQLARSISTEKIQPASNHRSVYLPVLRDYVPEIFDLFDFPSPSLVSGVRATTNVPSQALYLRNSAFIANQATHAAKRLLAATEATDDPARVALAMRWTLGRDPSDAERDAALLLIEEVRQRGTSGNSDAATSSDSESGDEWKAWFLTLFTTAEFRFLSDIDD